MQEPFSGVIYERLAGAFHMQEPSLFFVWRIPKSSDTNEFNASTYVISFFENSTYVILNLIQDVLMAWLVWELQRVIVTCYTTGLNYLNSRIHNREINYKYAPKSWAGAIFILIFH